MMLRWISELPPAIVFANDMKNPCDQRLESANASSAQTGSISAADAAWFARRGPGALVSKIRVPTLFLQGTVDTLFTLDEAIANYKILRANGVPTSMVWYCAGHGVCLTDPGDRASVTRATLALMEPPSVSRWHWLVTSRPPSGRG